MNEGSTNKGLIWAVVAILVVAIGAFLFFANNDDEGEEEAPEQTTSEQAPEEEATTEGNIVEVASNNPDLTTLVAAVEAAGLVDTLTSEGPFTVFAPTDAAFEAALEDLGITAEELLAREDLADILTFHVLAGEVTANDVIALDGQTVETVNGQSVTVTVEDGLVFINGAQVVVADVPASNGVVHVIDAVLLPEEE